MFDVTTNLNVTKQRTGPRVKENETKELIKMVKTWIATLVGLITLH